MIEEEVVVERVERGRIWVGTTVSGCGFCSQACGAQMVGKFLRGKPYSMMRVETGLSLKPGDRVVVGVPEGALVKGSFMTYAVPLLALFAGAVIGAWASQSYAPSAVDTLSAAAGFSGMLAALAVFRLKPHWVTGRSQVFLLRVLS